MTLAFLVVTVSVTSAWAAVREKVLHNFNEIDGTSPNGVIFDASGNLYGTTTGGGDQSCAYGGCGTVFELMPQAGGGWTEEILHYFSNNGKDGYYPSGGLIFDAAGNIYGTTSYGGNQGCGHVDGSICGTVFELIREPGGGWTKQVLHFFSDNGTDGFNPRAGLLLDAAGNLYGTTWYGGNGECFDGNGSGCGTVFELTPRSDGAWEERILYAFKGNGTDGISPGAALILDASGNLYGTNYEGPGLGGYGTVFELIPTPTLAWREKILHRFVGDDGNSPVASVVFDSSGNLYGTTFYGPAQGYGGPCNDGKDLGCGTVFELMPDAEGGWTEEILHYFSTNNGDAFNPSASLVFDPLGNLYSTAVFGGAYGQGAVFKLTPQAGGRWAERLYSFNGNDGSEPADGVIFDASDNLYGTTGEGGTDNVGTVFEITH